MNPLPVTSAPVDLGKGFSIEFRFDGLRLDAVWSPRMPHGKRARQLIPAYRVARDQFLAVVSQRMGVSIACVETREAN